jgi:hypothetical protein
MVVRSGAWIGCLVTVAAGARANPTLPTIDEGLVEARLNSPEFARAGAGKAPVASSGRRSEDALRHLEQARLATVPSQEDPGEETGEEPKRPTSFDWMSENVLRRIELRGTRHIGYHDHQVSGDVEAFRALNYSGLGGRRVTDTGSMSITGRKVLGMLDFQMQLADNRFSDPQQQQITLNYDGGPLKISAGDIRGSLLNTNRFASFNKSLSGAMATYRTGPLTVRALHSEAKGSARTVSLQGTNSAGPYFLPSGRIIDGSLQLQVDGQEMRLLRDFVLDSHTGAITFVDRVVPPTSTIVATFESWGVNVSRGTVRGAGATYDFGAMGQLGLTAIEQTGSGRTGRSTRLDAFQGQGAPSTPYWLQLEPWRPQHPIEVKVDGILQFEGPVEGFGGDYYFDPSNPLIFYFKRFVPSTSTVTVAYTPRPTQTVDGDRRVIGIDYRLPIGRNGTISYSQATGQMVGSATPTSGTARGIDGRYRFGDLNLRAAWRDVPSTFVSVESRGFNRNEKAVDFGADYARGPLRYSLDHVNSSVATRRITAGGDVQMASTRVANTRANATYLEPSGASWNLSHMRTFTRGASEARLDTTTLGTARKIGAIDATFALENQIGRGRTASGDSTDVAIQGLRLGARYQLGEMLSFQGRAALSQVRSGGNNGQGTDASLAAQYGGNGPWKVSASYAISNSGQLATLGGFDNGLGSGYDGNGFAGGAYGSGFLAAGPSSYRRLQLTSSYRASDRLHFDARFHDSFSEGSYASNAHTSAVGLGVNWDLGNRTIANFVLDQSRTRFLRGLGTSSSDALTLDAFIAGSPEGPWSYRLGVNSLVSGGQSLYRQSGLGFDGALSYRMNDRQRVSLAFQHGRTGGYYPQMEDYLGAFYEYRLYGNVSLVGSYKLRRVRNLDASIAGGSYRSSGFDVELMFNFAP